MGLHLPAKARLIFPALLGWVLGTALQLQQAVLHSWQCDASLLVLALVLWLPMRSLSLAVGWRMALAGISFVFIKFSI